MISFDNLEFSSEFNLMLFLYISIQNNRCLKLSNQYSLTKFQASFLNRADRENQTLVSRLEVWSNNHYTISALYKDAVEIYSISLLIFFTQLI